MEFLIDEKNLFIDGEIFGFDDFEFIEEIGSGENATAFTIKNKVTDRIEVVKIWKPWKYEKEVSPEKVHEEIRKNSHFTRMSGVADIYYGGVNKGVFYVVMEYIDGITLSDYLKSEKDFYSRYNILKKILATVETVLKMGYFHGDLHGKNVVITQDVEGYDDPILIDFGTSLFSGKEKSNKRDAKLLFELCFAVLSEFSEFEFLKKSIIEQGSLVLCELFQFLLVSLLDYVEKENWDGYAKTAYCARLAIVKLEFKFLDINLIYDHIERLALDRRYFDTMKFDY